LRWRATIAIVYGDGKRSAEAFLSLPSGSLSEANMVQTTNRFFDEVARLMNDAAGAAQGMRREAETMFRTQTERLLREFAVVQREEFEAVKDMARIAREENEVLKARVAALEARLGGSSAPTGGSGTATPGPSGASSSGSSGWGAPPSGAGSSGGEGTGGPASGGPITDGPTGHFA
jgi:BMFP domain-containing protein YqiC